MLKLVLVDDEQMFLESIAKYIHSQVPYCEIVGQARDGAEALDMLRRHPVDVVITDITMPTMDGLELAREIYVQFPNCITIILTGYNEFEYARTAIKYHVYEYLLKPVDYRELKSSLERIQQAVKMRSPINDFSSESIFFADLIMGAISTYPSLKSRFETEHFPFPLCSTKGCLLKLCFPSYLSPEKRQGQIENRLKTAISQAFPSANFYFVRKSSTGCHYIAIYDHTPFSATALADVVLKETSEPYPVEIYRQFQSLTDFLPALKVEPVNIPEGLSSQIQKALQFIHQNYATDLSRETVASAVYLSPSYFSSQFKKEMGASFMDYLTKVRIDVSIELLKSNMRINEIANCVGYRNRNRYIINFRSITGYTPSNYKKYVLCMEVPSDE